jgi:hypothetical protein
MSHKYKKTALLTLVSCLTGAKEVSDYQVLAEDLLVINQGKDFGISP